MSGARDSGPPALSLLEDAVHLLRTAPPSLLLIYSIGTLPFLLAAVAFWTDMADSAFARSRAPAESLGLAALFLWMKAWQAAFAQGVSRRIAGERFAEKLPSPGRLLRLGAAQSLVQPFGLVLLPAALLAVFPAAWVLTFVQSFSVLGTGQRRQAEEIGSTIEQTVRWNAQAQILLLVICLLYAIVFLDALLVLLLVPYLARTFLGIESAAARIGIETAFNGTLVMASAATAYAIVDPIARAAFAFRCFHGVSLRSGLDLNAAIHEIRSEKPAPASGSLAVLVAVGLAVALFAGDATVAAQRTDAAVPLARTGAGLALPVQTVSPDRLDRAIREVIRRPEIAWRMPRREEAEIQSSGFLDSTLRLISTAIQTAGSAFRSLFLRLFELVDRLFPRPGPDSGEGSLSLRNATRGILIGLLGLGALLVLAVVKQWRRGRRSLTATSPAEAGLTVSHVVDESVTADRLPEDGWIALARELAARGECRAAVRAIHLAALAHLSSRGSLTLSAHKSNLEYVRELARREPGEGELCAAFGEVVRAFERVWYGGHAASEGLAGEVMGGLERMRRA